MPLVVTTYIICCWFSTRWPLLRLTSMTYPCQNQSKTGSVFPSWLASGTLVTLRWNIGRVWVLSWMTWAWERHGQLRSFVCVPLQRSYVTNIEMFVTYKTVQPFSLCCWVLHELDGNYPLKTWCLIITDCKWIGMPLGRLQLLSNEIQWKAEQ